MRPVTPVIRMRIGDLLCLVEVGELGRTTYHGTTLPGLGNVTW